MTTESRLAIEIKKMVVSKRLTKKQLTIEVKENGGCLEESESDYILSPQFQLRFHKLTRDEFSSS